MGPLEDLIACPHCDTLHNYSDVPEGAQAHCRKCGAVMLTQRAASVAIVLSLALSSFLLMIAAISFPFLGVEAGGLSNGTSLLGTVMAFSDDYALPLAIAVAAFIVFIPLTRLGALIVAVTPLVLDRTPRSLHKRAFGLAEQLRPWSMAEIFVVGVAVALVKITALVSVTYGLAFWALAGLVVLSFWQDTLICRYTVWRALDTSRD